MSEILKVPLSLPWEVIETRWDDGRLISRWIGRGNLQVANITNNDEDVANFIVRACNKLAEELKEFHNG